MLGFRHKMTPKAHVLKVWSPDDGANGRWHLVGEAGHWEHVFEGHIISLAPSCLSVYFLATMM
jgi:hypothetical protein